MGLALNVALPWAVETRFGSLSRRSAAPFSASSVVLGAIVLYHSIDIVDGRGIGTRDGRHHSQAGGSPKFVSAE